MACTWTSFCENGHLLQVGIQAENFSLPEKCKYCGGRVRIVADDGNYIKGIGKIIRTDVILCMNLTNNYQWHEQILVRELSDVVKKLFV